MNDRLLASALPWSFFESYRSRFPIPQKPTTTAARFSPV
jgi:hypothetical protein